MVVKSATVRSGLFGVLVLGLVAPALAPADGLTSRGGPVVSWDRIEGTIILPDESPMQVGPYFAASLRFRIGGEGNVVLYTSSGYLFMYVKGLSWGNHYNNGPLGAGMSGTFVGTVVCDSIPADTASYQSADTPVFELNQGSGFFVGVLNLPQACRDEPEKIVFLLRHDPGMSNPNLAGKFVAYGAGRTVR